MTYRLLCTRSTSKNAVKEVKAPRGVKFRQSQKTTVTISVNSWKIQVRSN